MSPRGVPEPVVVVTGPAGSGKTQFVAEWVRASHVDDHVVWLTLEGEDGSASMFWTYLVEGLRRAGLRLPPLSAPPPTAPVTRSFLVRLASSLSMQQSPIVLVLDGVSSLTDPRWAGDLEFVARHAGAGVRLVLIGRWDPPLLLHRHRLAGTLTAIRSRDLAFTRQETADLLALHAITLSPAALTSLLEHTEGWAAGLRLFALALEGRGDADHLVDTITGEEATIAEYFAGEVLRAQSPHVRTFLLHTSILDTITPELAQVVTGRPDARRVLADLERTNAFVRPIDEHATAYRYHRLFAELLRAQLAYGQPDLLPQLHRRAAGWFAARGQVDEAVAHAVNANDWATAAAAVIANFSVGSLLLEGHASRLGAWFRDMPDDVDSPEAAMVSAALAVSDRRPSRCTEQLARAEDLVINRGCAYHDALALAGIVIEVLLADTVRDAERTLQAVATAESHLARLPAAHVDRHPELRVLVLAAKGSAQSRSGATDAAAATFAEVITRAGVGCERVKLESLKHLALIEAYRGRLARAERLANEAVELAVHVGLAEDRRPAGAAVALAWVAVERYDVESAGRLLRGVDPKDGGSGLVAAGYAVAKSRRLQARGELRGALNTLQEVTTAGGGPPPAWLARELALGQARLLTMMGHPDDAIVIVRNLPAPESADAALVHAAALLAQSEPERAQRLATPVTQATDVRSPVAVDAWLLLATIAAHTGDPARARAALQQALRLAAPEGQRRAVHQVWAQLRRILRDDVELAEQYRALGGNGTAANPRAGDPADPQQLVIVEPLSKREMEVLNGMAAMLPTEEIAASLYVSVNTVKTHVRSILRKLCASRRNEAVRRARALGLI
jgi:LuxR family maltose regulon positive regulatory protein